MRHMALLKFEEIFFYVDFGCVFMFVLGFAQLTLRIPPLIHLLHASSPFRFHSLSFSNHSSSVMSQLPKKNHSFFVFLFLLIAPYGPSPFPYISKYSDHDLMHSTSISHFLVM